MRVKTFHRRPVGTEVTSAKVRRWFDYTRNALSLRLLLVVVFVVVTVVERIHGMNMRETAPSKALIVASYYNAMDHIVHTTIIAIRTVPLLLFCVGFPRTVAEPTHVPCL